MEAVSRTACKSACAMSHRPFRPNIPSIRPLYQTHANGLRPTILPYRVRPISNTNPARDSPCRCDTELTNRVRSANRPISNTQRKKPYRMCFDHSSITALRSNWPKSPAISAVPVSPYQAIYKGKCSWKAIVSAQVIGTVRRASFRTRCPRVFTFSSHCSGRHHASDTNARFREDAWRQANPRLLHFAGKGSWRIAPWYYRPTLDGGPAC